MSSGEKSTAADVFQEQVISGARRDAVRNEAYLETTSLFAGYAADTVPERTLNEDAKMESHPTRTLLRSG